jgi:peptidoglycan hydrolase-like protein with peptidoglycan-binding domain
MTTARLNDWYWLSPFQHSAALLCKAISDHANMPRNREAHSSSLFDTPAPVQQAPVPLSGRTELFTTITRRVQLGLQSYGYYQGVIDGVVGKETRSALEKFQGDYGLKVTGTITPAVLDGSLHSSAVTDRNGRIGCLFTRQLLKVLALAEFPSASSEQRVSVGSHRNSRRSAAGDRQSAAQRLGWVDSRRRRLGHSRHSKAILRKAKFAQSGR